MSNNPFQKLVDQATEGLKGDHELLLDVQQELLGHLEESAGELAADPAVTPDEVVTQAEAHFGSPVEVADQLFEANRHRMSRRHVARILICWLLIPVMLLAGLALGVSRLGAIRVMQNDAKIRSAPIEPGLILPAYSVFAPPAKDLQTVLNIDAPENQRFRYQTDRFKTYWQQHQNDPDALHMLAYFLVGSHVAFEPTPGPAAPQDNESLAPADYLKFVNIGMEKDPDNALYPVLMAQVYLQKAFKPKAGLIQSYEFSSQPDLDAGLKMMALAASKPRYSDYTDEFRIKMLQRLPKPRYYEQYLSREAVVDQINTTASSLDSYTWRVLQYLQTKGDAAGCERLTQQAMKINLLLADSSNIEKRKSVIYSTSIGLLKGYTNYVNKIKPTSYSQQIDQILKSKAGASTDRADGLNPTERLVQETAKKVDIIPASIIRNPAYFRGLNLDQLKPLQKLQSVLASETLIMIWQTAFALLLVLSTLLAIIWSIVGLFRGQRVLILLPDWIRLRNTLIFGVFIPGALVAVMAEFGWIKQASVMWAIPAVLLIGIPALYEWTLTRRRCHELGIATPKAVRELIAKIICVGSIVIGYVLYRSINQDYEAIGSSMALVRFVIGWSLMIGGVMGGLYGMSLYVRYYSALNRRLASLWAGSVLILSLLITPWMLSREATWLQRDTLMLGHLGAPGGVKQLEGRFQQNLTQHTNQLIHDSMGKLTGDPSATGSINP